MTLSVIDNLIEPHKSFIHLVVNYLKQDPRIVGVSVAGSIVNGVVDQYSDVDFVIAVESSHFSSVLSARSDIASEFGTLLTCFTGEHVGDSRLLICLYDKPLLHVDLKFIDINDLASESSTSQLLWQKDERFSTQLEQIQAQPFSVDPQWIEDRFWIWIHYVGTKIARGEVFEVLEFLSFIRSKVLVPLALQSHNKVGYGVRKIETLLPDFSKTLESTIANKTQLSQILAVQSCIEIYLDLRAQFGKASIHQHEQCQVVATQFIRSI